MKTSEKIFEMPFSDGCTLCVKQGRFPQFLHEAEVYLRLPNGTERRLVTVQQDYSYPIHGGIHYRPKRIRVLCSRSAESMPATHVISIANDLAVDANRRKK